MSVYVDQIQEYPLDFVAPAARKHGQSWCHMIADTPKELLDMARKLRLSAAYIQKSSGGIVHFDLVPSKRLKAIRLGAIALDSKELWRKAKAIKEGESKLRKMNAWRFSHGRRRNDLESRSE